MVLRPCGRPRRRVVRFDQLRSEGGHFRKETTVRNILPCHSPLGLFLGTRFDRSLVVQIVTVPASNCSNVCDMLNSSFVPIESSTHLWARGHVWPWLKPHSQLASLVSDNVGGEGFLEVLLSGKWLGAKRKGDERARLDIITHYRSTKRIELRNTRNQPSTPLFSYFEAPDVSFNSTYLRFEPSSPLSLSTMSRRQHTSSYSSSPHRPSSSGSSSSEVVTLPPAPYTYTQAELEFLDAENHVNVTRRHLFYALEYIAKVLRNRGIRYGVMGGMEIILLGNRNRTTRDVDIAVDVRLADLLPALAQDVR